MRYLKFAILCLALLTILMNSAIIPIISELNAAFPNTSPEIIKLTLSLPALTNIIFSLVVARLSYHIPKKYLLIFALTLYTLSGIGCSFAPTFGWLLAGRALLGVGTGMISPLVTDLIAYFYKGEERTQMIGFSNASSNLAGIFIPLLAGWLAEFSWQYAFWVYGIGFFVLLTTTFFIPVTPLNFNDNAEKHQYSQPRMVWLVILTNFVVMLIFYTLPTNLSVFVQEEAIGTSSTAGFLVSISTLVSTLMGLIFSGLYNRFKQQLLLIGMIFSSFGFVMLIFPPSLTALILSEILVGVGLGVIFPFLSLTITQVTSGQQTTTALSMYSASFSLGIFMSPLFFTMLGNFTGREAIQTEFLFAAVIFCVLSLFVSFISRKQSRE
ncbi:MFS transporter [Pelolinea submarina]|uniref:Putative MFS family arabinose efflux permease n=1 Tax=Pelolinea submarina TaxID=913107 RepID=A0A3E0AHR1_9CHLR|nr:MFS transporter [Pelolinea submarina]REG11218.1 putative MFS family arabinose efflux permease [Pelolinea submarina]